MRFADMYAENFEQWEEWQRDYVYGVILILPPPEVSRPIAALREKYDSKSSRISPPHISVSDPLACPMTPELGKEITAQLSKFKPIEIFYTIIQASRDRPGVSYAIDPQEAICEIKDALHATSAFTDQMYSRRTIPAHMTIAEFLSIEESLAVCKHIRDDAPVGSFMCHELAYLVPDEEFRFRKLDTFLLGG